PRGREQSDPKPRSPDLKRTQRCSHAFTFGLRSQSALQNDDKLRRAALPILRRLLPSWADVTGPELKCKRVSGALTNCIFVVEGPPSRTASCSEEEHAAGCDAVREPSDERHQQPLATSVNSPPPGGTASAASRKVMMRVYGVGSDSLLVREKEITWLRRLSRLGIGARLLGTFGNGRLEQYLPSTTLTKADLRAPEPSAAIAARMAEMHSIVAVFPARRESATADTSLSDDSLAEYDLPGDLELWANVRKWVPLALEAAKELARIEPEKWATYEDRIGLFTLHEDIAALKERIDRAPAASDFLPAGCVGRMGTTVHALLGEVRLFVPASHLWWALWGLVQATQSEIDFDYLEYAAQRFELFRDGIRTKPADGGLADMDAE
ncbi:MAG: kinase-like domain-containing protein, partial [Olpidium bornovanus]